MSFLINAAKYYNAEPHQDQAWEELEAELPTDTLERFKMAYRGSPEPSVGFTKQTFEDLTGYSKDLFTDQEVSDCNRMLKGRQASQKTQN